MYMQSSKTLCCRLLLLPAQMFDRVGREGRLNNLNVNSILLSLYLLLVELFHVIPPTSLICSVHRVDLHHHHNHHLPHSIQIHLDIPRSVWTSSLCFSLSPPPPSSHIFISPAPRPSVCLVYLHRRIVLLSSSLNNTPLCSPEGRYSCLARRPSATAPIFLLLPNV